MRWMEKSLNRPQQGPHYENRTVYKIESCKSTTTSGRENLQVFKNKRSDVIKLAMITGRDRTVIHMFGRDVAEVKSHADNTARDGKDIYILENEKTKKRTGSLSSTMSSVRGGLFCQIKLK